MKQTDALNKYDKEKPVVHINALISAMTTSSREVTVEKNKIVYFNKNDGEFCYLLIDGAVVVKTSETRKAIARVEAPFFFGLNLNNNSYLQTVSEATFRVIETKSATEIIRRDNLWEHLYFVSRRIASYAYKKERSLSETTSHQQIVALLKMLAEGSDETRYTTPVVQYLQDNSSLSRSTIFSVLAELKASNKIEIQRGILIKVL